MVWRVHPVRDAFAVLFILLAAAALTWALMLGWYQFSVRQQQANDVNAAVVRVERAGPEGRPLTLRLSAWVDSLSKLPYGYQVSSRAAGPYQATPLPATATSEDLSGGTGDRVPLTDPLTGEVSTIYVRDVNTQLVQPVRVAPEQVVVSPTRQLDVSLPTAPTSLTVSRYGKSLDVAWLPPSSTGDLDVSEYVVLASPDEHTWVKAGSVPGTQLAARLSPASSKSARWVRVLARTQAGLSSGAAVQVR